MIPIEEKKQILAEVEADNGFMKAFVEDFLNDVPQDVQALEDALREEDHIRVERLAHSLKSVVGFFKALSTYELAKELEKLGREGNLKDGTNKFEELKISLDNLGKFLISTL